MSFEVSRTAACAAFAQQPPVPTRLVAGTRSPISSLPPGIRADKRRLGVAISLSGWFPKVTPTSHIRGSTLAASAQRIVARQADQPPAGRLDVRVRISLPALQGRIRKPAPQRRKERGEQQQDVARRKPRRPRMWRQSIVRRRRPLMVSMMQGQMHHQPDLELASILHAKRPSCAPSTLSTPGPRAALHGQSRKATFGIRACILHCVVRPNASTADDAELRDGAQSPTLVASETQVLIDGSAR